MVAKIFLFAAIATTFIENGDAKCVDGVLEYGVSPKEAEAIVDKHNEIRLKISCGLLNGQPKGSNLKALKYSPSLAKLAQEATNNCQFNPPPMKSDEFQYVGRNSFLQYSTAASYGADWNATFQDWVGKYRTYSFGPVQGGSNNNGLFTQLIWGNTEYIGCGYTYYLDNLSEYKYNKLYICAYGPAGNFVGQTPYELDKHGYSGCSPLL